MISVTPDSIQLNGADDNNKSTHQNYVTSSGAQPQRAVISYNEADSNESTASKSRSPSPSIPSPSPPPARTPTPTKDSATNTTGDPSIPKYIAFPASQIPPEFFELANPSSTELPSSSSLSTITDHNLHHQQQQQQQHEHDHRVVVSSGLQVTDKEPTVIDMSRQLLRALTLAGTRSLRQFVDCVVSRFGVGEAEELGDDEKIRRVELAICALLILVAGLIVVCICSPRNVTYHHHWDYFNPPK